MKNIFPLILFVFLLSGCPEKKDAPFDSTVQIINNSDKELIYCIYQKKIGDTTLSIGQPFVISDSAYQVKGQSIKLEKGHFVYNLNSKPNLYFIGFLFSRDSLLKYGWERIRDSYCIEKRFVLQKISFDSSNIAIITYP